MTLWFMTFLVDITLEIKIIMETNARVPNRPLAEKQIPKPVDGESIFK